MKVRLHKIPESTLEDFADKHGLTMVVRERGGKNAKTGTAFFACFERAELATQDGYFLISIYGDGHTPEEAIEAYGRKISEGQLVVDAFRDTRREIRVPRIKSTESEAAK